MTEFLPCPISITTDLRDSACDVLLFIDKNIPSELIPLFNDYRKFDQAFDSEISLFRADNLGGLPIIYAPVGNLSDYHDVRAYQKSTAKAINRAIKAGFKKPLLVIPPVQNFANIEICSILSAFHELYVPIQLREDVPEKAKRIHSLTVFLMNMKNSDDILREAQILESGRFIARDIGVGDPERMSPPNVEMYIKGAFPRLKVTVINDLDVLEKDYPLFEAVNRAAQSVKRHQGRIIYLEYVPPKEVKKTLLLVGKGVTYDTGGADIKAGGVMAGMSRDKCGAAAVAGFMKVVQEKRPEHIHVIGALCMVRNSVGEECYVADEIITSRAGVRVRVGNTDAEGRMCMADALCRMKELAVQMPNPHLFTIATLTGHAVLAVGGGYSIVIDNSVARKENHARTLMKNGEEIGEPFEISTLRQDDFDFNSGKVIGEDIVQCNNAPSSKTPRGHQIPAAFMIVTAGLDKHGINSDSPLKYTHIDIAGSAGEHPHIPTAAPIAALIQTHLQ